MMRRLQLFVCILSLLGSADAARSQDPSDCTFWVNATGTDFYGGSCTGQQATPGFETQHWQYNCVGDCGGGSTNNPMSLRLNGACRSGCNSHCPWDWTGVVYTDTTFSASGFDGEHGFFSCKCKEGAPRAIERNCFPGMCGHACWEPLIISLRDDQYLLTDPDHGVWFDLTADGTVERIPWTDRDSDEAFIVLDRNRNGVIDNGRELFSHVSPQPPAPPGELLHGFRALAVFDESLNGGNGDGQISADDKIFQHLQIWRDANHDGKTNLGELRPVTQVGLEAISLAYTDEHRYFDAFDNDFHFSATATFSNRSVMAWAVFFAAPHSEKAQNSASSEAPRSRYCFASPPAKEANWITGTRNRK